MKKNSSVKTWNKTWRDLNGPRIDQTSQIIFAKMQEKINFKNKTVVELGCGSGRLGLLAALAGAKSIDLVDFSENALRLSKEIFENYSGKCRIQFINSDIFRFAPIKQYDIVFSSGVVEHFSGTDFNRAIKKHLELTKDKAVIVVPAAPGFNGRRARSKKNQELFGWWQPLTKQEIFASIKRSKINCQKIEYQRFYTLYQFGFRRQLSRKRRLYKLVSSACSVLDRFIGGLSMTVIKSEEDYENK